LIKYKFENEIFQFEFDNDLMIKGRSGVINDFYVLCEMTMTMEKNPNQLYDLTKKTRFVLVDKWNFNNVNSSSSSFYI